MIKLSLHEFHMNQLFLVDNLGRIILPTSNLAHSARSCLAECNLCAQSPNDTCQFTYTGSLVASTQENCIDSRLRRLRNVILVIILE